MRARELPSSERPQINESGLAHCRSVLFEPDGTPRGRLVFDIDSTVRNNNGPVIDYGQYGQSKVSARTKGLFGQARNRGLGLSVATGQTLAREMGFLETFAQVGSEPHGRQHDQFFTGVSIFEDGGVYFDHATRTWEFAISTDDVAGVDYVRRALQGQLVDNKLFGAKAVEAPQQYLSQYQLWVVGVDYAEYLAYLAVHVDQLVSEAKGQGAIHPDVELDVVDPVQNGSPTIRAAGVSKKTALDRIYYLSHVVFLCNDHNDIAAATAVKTAGGGVICPNDAVEEIQVLADYIATAGPDEGISEALEQLLT